MTSILTASKNKTRRFECNLDGNLVMLIAESPTTGVQLTEGIYGVTAARGSKLQSKALEDRASLDGKLDAVGLLKCASLHLLKVGFARLR